MEDYVKTKLLGEQMSSVVFIQDYLQLYFDSIRLTLYIWPVVVTNNSTFIWGDLDYRNRLCQLIGSIVHQIELKEKEYLKILFENGNCIELNLDPKNPNIVAEIGFLDDTTDNNWIVFG